MNGQDMAVAFPLQIFFDGSCRVCSAEMESYRRKNPDDRLEFVDISDEHFNPDVYGKSLGDFMSELHVRDAQGNFTTGIDAFIAIWQAFPSGSVWRLAAAFCGLPGVYSLGRGGYRVFARWRHLLPRRRQDCEADSCSLNHEKTDRTKGEH
jgi:predicted DCC family thiol-disulfide oxidoreductase YuxK